MFIFSTLAVAASLVAAVAADHGHSLQARSHHHHVERSNLQKRFSGTATFYKTGLGACGQHNNPQDPIVALNSAQYGGGYPGPNCFKAISICAKGKCVGATIVDECPTCGYGSLDLSQGLFEQFASTEAGVFQMTWSFADGGGEPQPSTTKKPDPPAPTTTWKPEPSPEPTTWKPEPTTTWKPEPTTTWKPEPTTTWEEPKTTSTKKASTSTPPPETTSHHEPSTTSTSSTPTSTSSTTSTSTVESTTSVSSSVAVSTSASVTGTESSAVPSATATSGSATGSGNNNSSGSGSNLADAQKIMIGIGMMVVAGKQ